MSLDLKYSRGTCVQTHKSLQLPRPIDIETPWLEIDHMLVSTTAKKTKLRWWYHDSFFVIGFKPEKCPEFAAVINAIDGPPKDAPKGTVDRYRRMNGHIVLKVSPDLFDRDMLEHYVFNCENQNLETVKLRNGEVHAGDKIKLELSIKGYGRKCLKLYYKVGHFEFKSAHESHGSE